MRRCETSDEPDNARGVDGDASRLDEPLTKAADMLQ
jgi:hypothetical protein